MLTRRQFFALGGCLTAAGGLAAYARFVEPERIEFTHHRAPPGWPAFAHISDLHLRELHSMHEVIASEIKRQACSLIVITGDSIDRRSDLPILNELLSLLPAVPKIAILGNWEHWGRIDPAMLAGVYERWNGRLLINESVTDQGVTFVGLDDLVAGKPDLARALSTTSPTPSRLLLAHCPGYRDLLPNHESFDLVLSGHTHGGQVCPFGFVPFTPKGSGRYVAGWYRQSSPMYVSRGIGTSVMPIRWQCRPEVAFFSPA